MLQSIDKKEWHALTAQEGVDLLKSDKERGLTSKEASDRLNRFGPNLIKTKKGHGPLMRFLLQFHQPLVYILIVAGAITAALQEWVDSGVIFGVVLVNAIIGFVQESKAVKALQALQKTMTTEANVIRDGVKQRVASEQIVIGDLVVLNSGDKVPADIRLIKLRDLHVDESALTGESVPVVKHIDPLPKDTVVSDRNNMVYASGLVTYGHGIGVVVATGNDTEVGRISELLDTTTSLETPLTRNISHFSKLLLYVILGLALLTFVVGMLRGHTAFDMFMSAVALAVGAIPEGLPAVVTITLAIGVSRMARRRAIIRSLPAVETLGSTTVICSDKTGTLTENQMTVVEVYTEGTVFRFTGSGYQPEGSITKNGELVTIKDQQGLTECLRIGALCNESQLINVEGRWDIQGDPTEGALLVAAQKAGLSLMDLKGQFNRIDVIPFESENGYMATLHKITTDGSIVIYMKGSVEAVLHRCETMIGANSSVQPIDKEAIISRVEDMARRGLRVLAFAKKVHEKGHNTLSHEDIGSGMTFVGLQAMIDPPRQEAIEAVKKCHSAGIRVKMITGDHALTASAIAQQVGIKDPLEVITGKRLLEVPPEELIEVADRTNVFARVSPEQKLRLVEALQAKGNVVAMTGDGVNDAPALKRADIGVAMGITGTDVAKEAADMVLTDDNFASIEAAVEEGRGVYDNLTKFIVWTLPTNMGEGMVILAAIFMGVILPILPVQILWINMTTAVLLGLMLAFESKEPGIMNRPPRDPKTPILTPVLIWRIVIVGFLLLISAFGLFRLELSEGATPEVARTVAVNVFVMVELVYLFNCRSLRGSFWSVGVFSNPMIFVGVSIMIVLQVMFTYLPQMNLMFHSAPIGLESWLRIIGVSLSASFLIGTEKWLRSRLLRHHTV